MALTNAQINTTLNEAFAMYTGEEDVGTLSTEDIISTGSTTLTSSKEKFTGCLVNVLVKNWFTDTAYRSQYKDEFFENSAQYGAILQSIAVDIPEAIANPAWETFVSAYDTPSGSTPTRLHDTPIYIPIVRSRFYESSASWAIPITVTDAQWDTAVHNADELNQYVAFLHIAVDNGIVCHLEDMNNINRNNFMAEKISYAGTEGATGIHKVNLVELAYNDGVFGDTFSAGDTINATDYLNSSKAMLNGTEKIRLFRSYFSKMSVLFNTEGRKRFTPNDRLVIQVISAFSEKLSTVALSDTFHDEIVSLPLYSSVPSWQGLGTDLSWDNVTGIDIQLDDDRTVTQSGIVCFMCDKWGIMHTIKSRKVGVDHDDIKELTTYVSKFRDAFYNDLSMNAVVFTVEPYTIPSAEDDTEGTT